MYQATPEESITTTTRLISPRGLLRSLSRRRRGSALLQHVFEEVLPGFVTAPNHRPGRDVQEPHALRDHLVRLERLRGDVLRDRQVPFRRPHVLPERHHVHIRLSQQLETVHHLFARLAETEHHARLRDPRARRLRRPQHVHALRPVRPPVAHVRLQLRHGLHVVREDVDARRRHRRHEVAVAAEIRRQRLHEHARRVRLQPPHRLRDVPRALVRQLVAIDGGENDVVETPRGYRLEAVPYKAMSGWCSKASGGVERRRGRGSQARDPGRRDAPGK
eukprot:6081-Pelagococcus_subviridis.AAC.3